jgi:hypothetical protein
MSGSSAALSVGVFGIDSGGRLNVAAGSVGWAKPEGDAGACAANELLALSRVSGAQSALTIGGGSYTYEGTVLVTDGGSIILNVSAQDPPNSLNVELQAGSVLQVLNQFEVGGSLWLMEGGSLDIQQSAASFDWSGLQATIRSYYGTTTFGEDSEHRLLDGIIQFSHTGNQTFSPGIWLGPHSRMMAVDGASPTAILSEKRAGINIGQEGAKVGLFAGASIDGTILTTIEGDEPRTSFNQRGVSLHSPLPSSSGISPGTFSVGDEVLFPTEYLSLTYSLTVALYPGRIESLSGEGPGLVAAVKYTTSQGSDGSFLAYSPGCADCVDVDSVAIAVCAAELRLPDHEQHTDWWERPARIGRVKWLSGDFANFAGGHAPGFVAFPPAGNGPGKLYDDSSLNFKNFPRTAAKTAKLHIDELEWALNYPLVRLAAEVYIHLSVDTLIVTGRQAMKVGATYAGAGTFTMNASTIFGFGYNPSFSFVSELTGTYHGIVYGEVINNGTLIVRADASGNETLLGISANARNFGVILIESGGVLDFTEWLSEQSSRYQFFTNYGVVRAASGSTLNLPDNFDNHDLVSLSALNAEIKSDTYNAPGANFSVTGTATFLSKNAM